MYGDRLYYTSDYSMNNWIISLQSPTQTDSVTLPADSAKEALSMVRPDSFKLTADDPITHVEVKLIDPTKSQSVLDSETTFEMTCREKSPTHALQKAASKAPRTN